MAIQMVATGNKIRINAEDYKTFHPHIRNDREHRLFL